ncbi:MAG: DUF1684 domain-containing protein [Bacteroidia bacterium]|nr:DUF1684 domain-containing protein [Bacteroidia bacterium]
MKITALNLLVGLNLLTFSCNSPTVKDGAPLDVVAYKLEIEKWHEKRQVDLKAEDGWLNLVGLFWLKEGSNSFGSGNKNDIVFPAGKIPVHAGTFIVNQGIVSIEVAPATEITQRGKPLSNGIIFSPDSASNAKLEYGSLRWFIIQRDKIVGIRLRDLESEDVQKFNGIEHYPIDPAWRIEATVEPSVEPKMIDITNVLGQTTSQASQGTVVFTINETAYRLDALDGGKDELFVIFGDHTNKKETYPAGRYIYIKRPDETNRTIIDFNKAYNPPCAFTAFATCPLPPKQNILNVEIPAGEKNYSGPEHETH